MGAAFVFGVSMFSAVISMPRFYQTVRGVSATASGYYIWPLIVGLMGGSAGGGVLISRAPAATIGWSPAALLFCSPAAF